MLAIIVVAFLLPSVHAGADCNAVPSCLVTEVYGKADCFPALNEAQCHSKSGVHHDWSASQSCAVRGYPTTSWTPVHGDHCVKAGNANSVLSVNAACSACSATSKTCCTAGQMCPGEIPCCSCGSASCDCESNAPTCSDSPSCLITAVYGKHDCFPKLTEAECNSKTALHHYWSATDSCSARGYGREEWTPAHGTHCVQANGNPILIRGGGLKRQKV
eukprot:143734_1